MSASGRKGTLCYCFQIRCRERRCSCFKAGLPCSPSCLCKDCDNPKGLSPSDTGTGNTEKNNAEALLNLKRTSAFVDLFPSPPIVVVPPHGFPVSPDFSGCRCRAIKCANGKCPCFGYSYRCTDKCRCQDCANPNGLSPSDTNTGNTEKNKAEALLNLKRTSSFPSPPVVVVPPGGFPVSPDFSGCRCRKIKCASVTCPCFGRLYRCTSKCKCQDCANPKGLGGGDTNTEPRQGHKGGISNIPPSRNNTGSDQNKRPRRIA